MKFKLVAMEQTREKTNREEELTNREEELKLWVDKIHHAIFNKLKQAFDDLDETP